MGLVPLLQLQEVRIAAESHGSTGCDLVDEIYCPRLSGLMKKVTVV